MVPPEKQILICLWMLGNQECFRSVSDRFNQDISTIRLCMYRVCDVLIANVKQFIKWPSTEEMIATANVFERKSKLTGVIGCVDGSHIPIVKPSVDGDSYINRKGYPSILLQGVCNNKRQFIDVFCGMPGSVHDARVLRNSRLYQYKLSSLPANLHLLGDSAYPLSGQIITPYRDNGQLTARQKKFNYVHSGIRITIEHAFGILKQKFRCLKGLNIYKTDMIPKIILACCILHNVAIEEAFDCNLDDIDENLGNDNSYVPGEVSTAGIIKRNYLAQLL